MFANLTADYRRLAGYRGRRSLGFALDCLFIDNGFQAVLLYRMARWFKVRRVPLLGAALWRLQIFLTGADINPNAAIGPGLVISHGVGLVVGGAAGAGSNLLLHHLVTIGAPSPGRIGDNPRIGDDVSIGAGAVIVGAVAIGDGAFIGALALVAEDVPAGARVLAPPAVVAPRES
jgi:serine O-acetyltransferase